MLRPREAHGSLLDRAEAGGSGGRAMSLEAWRGRHSVHILSTSGADLQVCAGPPGPASRHNGNSDVRARKGRRGRRPQDWSPAPRGLQAPKLDGIGHSGRPALCCRLLVAALAAAAAFGQTTVGPAAIPNTPAAYRDLKFPPLKQIPIPNVATYTLPNGMKLYLLEDHELPIVAGTVRVRTGNLLEPADKVGLASIAGTVMRSGGTPNKTGDQIDEELENIAASVESEIGESSGSVSFSALKENTGEVLGIFKDVLTEPEFRQEKIDLAMSEMRSGIARSIFSWRNSARRKSIWPCRKCAAASPGGTTMRTAWRRGNSPASSMARIRPMAGRSNMPRSTTSRAATSSLSTGVTSSRTTC